MTDETSLSISSSTQETPLLQNNPSQDSQPHPKIKNLKPKIFFLLRILIVLIAAILILYFIYSKNRNKRPEPLSPYESGLSDFYCHLTPHPKLCRRSMSSATNATALQPGPALLFAASLQLVITQLNHTTASIARARPGPGLSTCQALIRDSLSRLNGYSAGLHFFSYGDDNGLIEDEVVQGVIKSNIGKCLLALRGIEGVEEVKLGVEKGRKLWNNFISLFHKRVDVINDFYNRFIYEEDEGYNYVFSYFFGYNRFYWYGIDYVFLVCLYSVMYLFIALLYFLFWQ